jgi:hypothetical protein
MSAPARHLLLRRRRHVGRGAHVEVALRLLLVALLGDALRSGLRQPSVSARVNGHRATRRRKIRPKSADRGAGAQPSARCRMMAKESLDTWTPGVHITSVWHFTHSKTRYRVVSSLSQTRACRVIQLHAGHVGK